ncbi:Adenylosuccinate synthetase 2 [Spatholobus suberectus]|nr:Adenylosuccinate synthetase 2 [Spatholobus suberectus]
MLVLTRNQGGANAGHTIYNVEGKNFALHLVPYGILNEGMKSLLQHLSGGKSTGFGLIYDTVKMPSMSPSTGLSGTVLTPRGEGDVSGAGFRFRLGMERSCPVLAYGGRGSEHTDPSLSRRLQRHRHTHPKLGVTLWVTALRGAAGCRDCSKLGVEVDSPTRT